MKLFKGGSWDNYQVSARSVHHRDSALDFSYYHLGFRLLAKRRIK